MAWEPEDLARFLFPHSKRKIPVIAALMKHPNIGVTAEDINKELGLETDTATIDETQRILREIKDLIEICSQKNERGRPTNVYKPGRLMDTYNDPTYKHIFEKERVGYCDYGIDIIIRCNDPMQCHDPNCQICAKAGKKTCWTREKD
jgi:hypothetical protein